MRKGYQTTQQNSWPNRDWQTDRFKERKHKQLALQKSLASPQRLNEIGPLESSIVPLFLVRKDMGRERDGRELIPNFGGLRVGQQVRDTLYSSVIYFSFPNQDSACQIPHCIITPVLRATNCYNSIGMDAIMNKSNNNKWLM
ncbi:hypothetical protein CDAR_191571 [Caerostris darwini]|uniref:Uncharacterized protein n=1 Tax=Caerostris darwini TaxID=1538125 RepID=A0AAV4UBD4_9ARAC|nr:hypothetical protein CDAR_191571 [Caerostris darwini]